ncbi:hypothetical protein PRIPAC_81719 [Pristionchus pacificus]|uniref:Integrase_H2C2 domain-containing protein n=1 Tax=Pristionchus pacificus TaxID=54126 RepID=A0A2A6CJD6_PRIPA|nr:hypothetical protein PRIPAC_81719 [Pristionchus pacificus]|eukprot:PDM78226.1 hypothetical protein PRIPAC_30805 [Pristionchus pacificus]
MVTGIEDEMDKMEIDKEDFFVIKKSREVKGEINGMQRTVILDSGAEASLIEEKWLEGMKGVEILPVDEKRLLQDAQQNPIRTTGKVILDVKLEMGRKARIGFHITKSEVGIIIGGKGLDAIGVELREIDGKRRKENRIEEDQWEDTTSATLLKDYCIPSGEMKIVWVKGDPMNTVRLNAESDAVIEGISMGEKMVGIPMMNITEEDQSIGTWKKLKEEIKEKMSTAKVARVKKEENNEGKENESKDNWWKKMIENHEEGIDDEIMEILRRQKETRAQKEYSNKKEVEVERKEKREKWRIEQEKDEWINEVKKGLQEVGMGHTGTMKLIKMLKREYVWGGMDKDVTEVIKGCVRCKLSNAQKRFVPELVPRVAKEPMEIVAIDLFDLGRGLKGARMQILMKKTNEQVNERLEKERELMKRRYDNQNKNRKVDEPRVGDRVYVRKEIRGELIPKRMVDADDPLHWSWVCGQCGTRALGTVWKSAPETLHEIPISCVLDVILIASVIRKEGETASRLLVEDVLERRELQGVTEEDVKQGLLRACQHINHCKVEGKTMVFSFGEDIPRRFHAIYADLLGEEKEANRVFGGFLSFVSLEEVLGKGRKEYRSEYFQWKEVCTETIEEEARELRKKGAKILIVWPGRNASYKE